MKDKLPKTLYINNDHSSGLYVSDKPAKENIISDWDCDYCYGAFTSRRELVFALIENFSLGNPIDDTIIEDQTIIYHLNNSDDFNRLYPLNITDEDVEAYNEWCEEKEEAYNKWCEE